MKKLIFFRDFEIWEFELFGKEGREIERWRFEKCYWINGECNGCVGIVD